jgi:hypothetical protein
MMLGSLALLVVDSYSYGVERRALAVTVAREPELLAEAA